MLLFIWGIFGTVVALMSIRRPGLTPATLIALSICIPFIAGDAVTDGHGHPSIIVGAIAVTMTILVRPRSILEELSGHLVLYSLLTVAHVLLAVSLSLGANGQSLPVVTFVLPITIFISIRLESRRADVRFIIRNAILFSAVVQVATSLLTFAAGRPLLFVEQFSSLYWFSPDFARAMGTTDHPLVMSLLLAAAIPLLGSLRSAVAQIALSAGFIVGLLLSESRTGIVAGIIGIVVLFVRRPGSTGAKFLAVISAALASGLILQGPLADGVSERFANDGGSASVRGAAVQSFLARWQEFAFSGAGNDGATQFRVDEGLRSSLESAFLIFSVNYGILFTVVYFATLGIFLFRGERALRGARMAAIVALVLVQTFSSISTLSASSIILWSLVGLASLSAPASRQDRTSEGLELSRSRTRSATDTAA